MDKYDICLARIRFRNCNDRRPWILVSRPTFDTVRSQAPKVAVVPISASLDLFKPNQDFLIRAADPNFVNTGLKRDSYAIGEGFTIYVPISRFERKVGSLVGSLLAEFVSWEG